MRTSKHSVAPLYKVRKSPIQGRGVFALRRIRKGRRIIEYKGKRITNAEADSLYESDERNPSHTVLFIVNKNTVIDADRNGNEARFFNHSCDPNCESVVEGGRVYIDAIRNIQPGVELAYDYSLEGDDDDEDEEGVFACKCGSKICRGTLLGEKPKKRKKKRKKKAGDRKSRGS